MALSLERLRVRQVHFDVFDDVDDVNEVANGYVFLLIVSIVAPQDLLAVFPFRFIHELVARKHDRMGISMNDQWFLCLFSAELFESIWLGAADSFFIGQAGVVSGLAGGCLFRGLASRGGSFGTAQTRLASNILLRCN